MGTEETTGFGGILEIFKDILTSGPANAAMGLAKYGTKIGMFFGATSPATKNMVDFASAVQDYAENKITPKELANKGVQDVANWLIADKLQERGWSPEMSTIAAGIGSKLVGGLAGMLGVDSAISGIAGMVTGGHSTNNATPGFGGKPSAAERTVNT